MALAVKFRGTVLPSPDFASRILKKPPLRSTSFHVRQNISPCRRPVLHAKSYMRKARGCSSFRRLSFSSWSRIRQRAVRLLSAITLLYFDSIFVSVFNRVVFRVPFIGPSRKIQVAGIPASAIKGNFKPALPFLHAGGTHTGFFIIFVVFNGNIIPAKTKLGWFGDPASAYICYRASSFVYHFN
jgi:hypothetical protein